MRVFVTGATGYIGSAAADALRAAGHGVIGLARSEEAATHLALRGVTPVLGDLREPETLEAAVKKSDAVLHAGTTGDGDLDREAVSAMLGEAAGRNLPFVYTSGVWIYGDTGGQIADESFPLNPAAVSSWRPSVEERVFAFARQGLRASIVRAAICYGHGAGIPGTLVDEGREKGVVRIVGDGGNRWPLVHVEDLAELQVALLGRAEPGTVVNAAAESAPTVREIATAAAEAAGVPGRVEVWALEDARARFGPYADALAMDQQVSSELAKRLFGWSPSRTGILEELRGGSYAVRPEL
jgi:nucleoside-diphosphate-sugar epimerase